MKYQKVIKEACIRGCDAYKNGLTSLQVCETSIMRLENSGNTNAGFGSNLTWDGKIECDASIMDGSNLQYGACTNVSNVKNPIQLARNICEKQSKRLFLERIPPMMLAGEGAMNYAKDVGCTLIEPETLISSKAKRCYDHYKAKVTQLENINNIKIHCLDTVGAVCVDLDGNCAAGCSSGGLILKISGRVGQAATYGAGCWAQNSNEVSIAVCTTGNGEYLMKTLLAKEIANDLLLNNDCPVTTLHKTFTNKFIGSPFLPKTKELYAGCLALIYYPKQRSGEVLWGHTTKSLCLGYMSTFQKMPKVIN